MLEYIQSHWLGLTSLFVSLASLSGFFWAWRHKKRDFLIKEVQDILEDCRALPSWNWDEDRSELNLPGSLGGDERELHYQSLRALYRIRGEISRLHEIHFDLSDEDDY